MANLLRKSKRHKPLKRLEPDELVSSIDEYTSIICLFATVIAINQTSEQALPLVVVTSLPVIFEAVNKKFSEKEQAHWMRRVEDQFTKAHIAVTDGTFARAIAYAHLVCGHVGH